MTTSFHPIQTIANANIPSSDGQWIFPSAGVASDFALLIFLCLLVLAFSLCLTNWLFLRGHEISRAVLEANPSFLLLIQNRRIAEHRFKPWERVVGNLLCKVGLILLAYALTSAKGILFVWAGLWVVVCFFGYNVFLLLREVLCPESVFNRRYVYYRRDPTFIRTRLFFELARRFVYFFLAFALGAYAIHRITGNGVMFSVEGASVPLFIQHLQSALTGMTSLGTDPISYVNGGAVIFSCFRGLFTVLLVVTFVNIIISGMAAGTPDIAPCRVVRQKVTKVKSENGLYTKEDVVALVQMVIEKYLKIPGNEVRQESDVIRDFDADSLDVQEIHLELEGVFPGASMSSAEMSRRLTIQQMAEFYWDYLQRN